MEMIHLPACSTSGWTRRKKQPQWGTSVIGLFTTFVQTTKLLGAKKKSAMDLVHALLGVSHSRWASEIASFLSRWRRALPSSLTSRPGVARLLGLMQGPASKLWRAGFFYLFLLDTHSTVPCSPPLTLKAQKENIAILQTNSTLKIKFFFVCGQNLISM